MAFTLSIGGQERALGDDGPAEFGRYIVDVACSRTEFLILTNEATGEYVQCAEAYERLVAERRDRQGDASFKQYRIVRKGASREKLPPRVAGFEGYEKREVLDVEDVAALFEDFLESRPLAAPLEAFDVTDEYAEAAQAAEELRRDPPKGVFGRIKRLFGG